jgi:excisionase family DNA binding protein
MPKERPQQLDRDWLTVKQAADYLQVGTLVIRQYVKRGILEGSQLVPKGKVRISAISVEKALQKRH